MDTPLYPPAQAYEPPIPQPFERRLGAYSLAELMSAPEAWAVVLKHAPQLERITASPLIQPQLSVFQVESFVTFAGLVDLAAVAAIDRDLQALPADAWPAT